MLAGKIFPILVSFCSFVTVKGKQGTLPEDIQKCRVEDKDCMLKVANVVIKQFRNGYPALGIPPLEPFHINGFTISQNSDQPVNINMEMRDLDFHGYSDQKYTKLVGFDRDPNTSKFELYSEFPKMTVKGKYKMSGRILSLPVSGDGNIEYNITGVEAATKLKLSSKLENGVEVVKVEKYKIQVKCKNLHVHLENLFNGDKVLGENMNNFLNENWEIIWEEMEPATSRALVEANKVILENIFKKVAYSTIFLDD